MTELFCTGKCDMCPLVDPDGCFARKRGIKVTVDLPPEAIGSPPEGASVLGGAINA